MDDNVVRRHGASTDALRSSYAPIAVHECIYCRDQPVDETVVFIQPPGLRVAVPGRIGLCSRCRRLVRGGSYDAVLERTRHTDFADFPDGDVLELIRASAAALNENEETASVTATAVAPINTDLLAVEGFESLDSHTGATEELGPLWPEEHRVAIPDSEPGLHDDGISWFVRSPWPSITLQDILFRLLWGGVEREPFSQAGWSSRVTEVFSFTETQACEWIASNSEP